VRPAQQSLLDRSRRLDNPAQPLPLPFSAVSTASSGDLEDLIYFLLAMRDEIEDGRIEDDLLLAQAHDLVRREHGVVFIVRGDLGVKAGIEASLGVMFQRWPLSRNYYLRSVWNVVVPVARRTGHAKSLLKSATDFADALGRPLYLNAYQPPRHVCLEDTSAEPSPKLRLCSRHMALAGRIFAHIPEVADQKAS